MKDIVKNVIALSIAIPLSLIGMSVAGSLVEKYSKKKSK